MYCIWSDSPLNKSFWTERTPLLFYPKEIFFLLFSKKRNQQSKQIIHNTDVKVINNNNSLLRSVRSFKKFFSS